MRISRRSCRSWFRKRRIRPLPIRCCLNPARTTTSASRLVPSFTNYNDASILALGRSSRLLTLIGVVVLVPPVEECFFRGLIFATLYRKSHWAAYIVSMLAFTAIHIMGYIGTYSAAELLIAIAQYLPAGLCLAWSYTKAETIFAPILIHAIINFVAISGLR